MHESEQQPDVVVAAKVASEIEANLIVAALVEHGIEARAVGGLTSGFRTEAPGKVRVLVRAEDAADAAAVIDAVLVAAAEIDWSQIDVGEMED
ncbi:MAG: DUF2007 domain-containing protein [Phycisphaeraceae bacterium]|nr:DUF2007 domain-containing protein [Phycisphaeraceae bacterium]MCW5764140.1 DUF2007 domain-containing protein [Phycisphaeraceae bacterium]